MSSISLVVDPHIQPRIGGLPLDHWLEIRSERGDRKRVPSLVSTAFAYGKVHAFFYEPWSPVVIRVRTNKPLLKALRLELEGWTDPPELVDWSPDEDAEYFGPEIYERAILPFFEAATKVAYETTMLTTSDLRPGYNQFINKLVHCFLNAQDIDTPGEARFGRDFFRNRYKQARRDYGLLWWRRAR